MCGIAGAVNFKMDLGTLTRDMLHRGPDEQCGFEHEDVVLHHHRLAILDIAGGKQPMHFEHLTLIFNGQIYNHLDLRRKYDLQCSTNSDTETILHLYAKLGVDFLSDLDGMFAFALLDKKEQRIFIARDRAGKKPLYYYQKDKTFLFSSELNALRSQLELEIADIHIQQFVRMGYFYKSSTPYKHITELEAGSYGIFDLRTSRFEVKKWWSVHSFFLQRSNDSFETALERIDQMLHQAVSQRVSSSDLEVGAFLSGGIDSGIITAIAQSYNSDLKTFTVSFAGEYDESSLAQLVANRYGTQHHTIPISFDNLEADIEKILFNYGEPFFDSSAIPSYYVSKEAKKHLTVILNGDGGDEVFGGYRRYVPFSKYDFFSSSPLTRKLAAGLHKLLPPPHSKKSKYNFGYRLVDLARKDGLDTYLSATVDSFDGYEQYLVSEPGYLDKVRSDFQAVNASGLSGLQKIMNLDFDNILPGDLLVKMDIATMAHSLEGRSPMLAKSLLEYVPTLPDRYKVNGQQTKHILRTLAEKYLPAELIHQPKRGFEIPLKNWVDNQLKNIIGDYILSPNAYCRNYVRPGFIEDLVNNKISVGKEKRAKMIWTLFSLEVWYKNCFLRS